MAVKKRLVLMFPGFEPVPVEAHCRRFVREARKTAPVYSMVLATSEIVADRKPETGVGTGAVVVHASGAGWAVETQLVVYDMSEFNEAYAARTLLARVIGGYLAWADFIISGTFRRYLTTAIRYGIFFVLPLLVLAAACVAGLVVCAIARMLFPDLPGAVLWLLGMAGFASAIVVIGKRWHLLLVLDDWTFARDLARSSRPELERRFTALSADIALRLEQSEADEVVFAAHSFGAIAAVIALGDAPQARDGSKQIGLLTAGSSLLKIALHPAAERLREAVRKIVAADMPWLDVQSVTDILNFYGTRPAELIAGRSGANQNTTKVRFRNQLAPESYHAIRRDFFRVHRQFVFGVERRTHYSYHAVLCGPEPFAEVARRGGLLDDWDHLDDRKEPQG